MPGIQSIIVIVIVALAAIFTIRKLCRMLSGLDSGCHCDGGCGLSNPLQCESSDNSEESGEPRAPGSS
jgi:hypothetical protein